MSTSHFLHGRQRRGAILMIVVAFLALGLSLGIAFLFFASHHAVNMRIYREAIQTVDQDQPPDPPDIANETYKQLIYDMQDDLSGSASALRGCSLARAMYGAYYNGTPTSPNYTNNDVPYNGIGRFHATGAPRILPSLGGADAATLINYQYFQGPGTRNDQGVFDPERVGYRADAGFVLGPLQNTWSTGPNPNYIPLNAPYTYPDAKDIYLGAIDPTTGNILVQSYFRPNIFGRADLSGPYTGPSWTSSVGKHMIHRPRMQENPAFPAPTSATGDVENLVGKIGGTQMDSIWMDVGYPMKRWRGFDYKPMVAMLIVDLDGRVNIHTAGNNRGAGGASVSLQGWGGWEVNLKNIFQFGEAQNLLTLPGGKFGTSLQPTKFYNPDGIGGNSAPSGSSAQYYAPVDVDGSITTTDPNNSNGANGAPFALPIAGTGYTTPAYPNRHAGGSAASGERLNHPMLYNPYFLSSVKPASPGPNRTFGPTEMQLLMNRFNGDQLNYSQSELAQLMKNNLSFSSNFGSPPFSAGSGNPRYLMTTISNEVMRPGLSPWLSNVAAGSPSRYALNQTATAGVANPALAPTPVGKAFPDPNARTAFTVSGINDFDSNTWKSLQAGALSSMDLNRKLADYRVDPTQPYEAAGNVTPASAATAIADRQRMAQDIFDRLCAAVGADNSAANLAALAPSAGPAPGGGVPPNGYIPCVFPSIAAAAEYRGLRYLAQLAVNIVDLIDNDDYITPFVWNAVGGNPVNPANFTSQQIPMSVVFGTELPRLVINEAALLVDNGSPTLGDPLYDSGLAAKTPKAKFYVGKLWVELLNPLTPGQVTGPDLTPLSHNGGAPLRFQGNDVYRIVLTKNNNNLRHADNVDGRNDGNNDQPNNAPINTAGSGSTAISLSGTGGVYANNGGAGTDVVPPSTTGGPPLYSQPRAATSSFCLVGPENTPGDAPAVVPSFTTPLMEFRMETEPGPGLGFPAAAYSDIILQRLACPHLPPGPTNPYVNVDYMQFSANAAAKPQDHRTVDASGNIAMPNPITNCKAFGRKQPYSGKQATASDFSEFVPAQPNPGGTGMWHTFFKHNGTGSFVASASLTQPFDWLVHLDRALISPIELLNVSAYKPHELMQQFITGAGKHLHMANWTDDAHRLHRALALLDTRSRILGIPHGGREPGRVNVNTVWHRSVWQAMHDRDVGNFFTAAQADAQFAAFMANRTPGPGGKPAALGAVDKPVWNFGAPEDANSVQFPAAQGGIGVNNTLLRGAGGTPVLDVPGQPHPYLKKDLLNKVYNKTTTRSNVFAVWMTIGYFQVTNSGTKPMQLGQEIGITDGTNIRNQFFAIIDRSNLAQDTIDPHKQGQRPIFFSYEPAMAQPLNVVDPPMTGPGPFAVNSYIPGNVGGGAVTGTYEDSPWTVKVGTQLQMDIGNYQELVTVTAVNSTPAGAQIKFTCAKPHARGCALMIADRTKLGNPGPQPGFYFLDPTYTPVIPVVVQTQ